MANAAAAALRVALVAENGQRNGFRSFLVRQGIDVVLDAQLGAPLPRSWNGAEVLLLAINSGVSGQRLQELMGQSPLPVVVNKGGVGNSEIWGHELLAKLEGLAHSVSEVGRWLQTHAPQAPHVVAQGSPAHGPNLRVVVLGASIGGPEAVARFLRALPSDLPLVFVLAQHIPERFQDRLAAQLNKSSGWRVAVLSDQQQLQPGWVWLLPAQHKVAIDPSGMLTRCADGWDSAQKPDINAVLDGVANSFGARSGAIMFSGLQGGGARGCETIARRGGFVWAQTAQSCTLANLPAAVQRSVAVDFRGTPEQLAQELAFLCRQQSTTIN